MKTPDEIKKGLECCNNGNCENCPYRERKIDCADVLREDTLAYIRQLEDGIDRIYTLTERIKKSFQAKGLSVSEFAKLFDWSGKGINVPATQPKEDE